MIHTFRIERLCIGHHEQADELFQTEKEVNRAFAKLGMVIEQLLSSGPFTATRVATLFTLDGLDVRVDSSFDAMTIRNVAASVVSDVNVAHPGLNLSLIWRATQGSTPTQSHATSSLDTVEGSTLPIPVEEDELAPIAYVAAASVRTGESGLGRIAA